MREEYETINHKLAENLIMSASNSAMRSDITRFLTPDDIAYICKCYIDLKDQYDREMRKGFVPSDKDVLPPLNERVRLYLQPHLQKTHGKYAYGSRIGYSDNTDEWFYDTGSKIFQMYEVFAWDRVPEQV